MTAEELFKALNALGWEYEVIEVFEDSRFVRFPVESEEKEPSDD